jgi:hypothetical protein
VLDSTLDGTAGHAPPDGGWHPASVGATLAADRHNAASAWAFLRAHALLIGALLLTAALLTAAVLLLVRGRRARRAAVLARSAPLAAKVLAAFAALEAALAGSRFARPPDASVLELGRALQSAWRTRPAKPSPPSTR